MAGDISVYHYKARAYSPTWGRFLQTDPIGYGAGLNWYAYVGNDPLNAKDPSGLAASSCPNGDPGCSIVDEIVVTARRDRTNPAQLGWEWLTGTGPPRHIFTDRDRNTKELQTSPDLQKGRCKFAENYKGKYPADASFTNGSTEFGVDDYALSDTATEQYTGSFDYDFRTIGDGRMRVNAFNMSSVRSALGGRLIHKLTGVNLPEWERGEGPGGTNVMGNTYQSYTWTEPLPKVCPK